MHFRRIYDRSDVSLYLRYIAICLSFSVGVLYGFVLFFDSRDLYISLMRRCFGSSVSIIGLIVIFVPLLISALIFTLYSFRSIFCLTCLLEGVIYSLAVAGCFYSTDRGACFLSPVVLFSSHICAALTLVVAFYFFANRFPFCRSLWLWLLSVVLLSVLFQYFCLQPYLFAVI